MNKILLNLLVLGTSLAGIQSAFAVKTISLEERDVNTTPRTPTKVRKPKMIPNGPMKPSLRAFGEARAAQDPNEYEMRGNTLWKKPPPPPVSSFSSMRNRSYYR